MFTKMFIKIILALVIFSPLSALAGWSGCYVDKNGLITECLPGFGDNTWWGKSFCTEEKGQLYGWSFKNLGRAHPINRFQRKEDPQSGGGFEMRLNTWVNFGIFDGSQWVDFEYTSPTTIQRKDGVVFSTERCESI